MYFKVVLVVAVVVIIMIIIIMSSSTSSKVELIYVDGEDTSVRRLISVFTVSIYFYAFCCALAKIKYSSLK